MKRYLLETSVIINYLRDKEGAAEVVKNLGGELVSSFVCLAELYEGVYRVKQKERQEKAVLNFFTGLSEIYGLDSETAKMFGQIRAELKRRGKVIEDLDIFLAATCLAYNLTLVTYNPEHFERVKGLEVLGLKPTS